MVGKDSSMSLDPSAGASSVSLLVAASVASEPFAVAKRNPLIPELDMVLVILPSHRPVPQLITKNVMFKCIKMY